MENIIYDKNKEYKQIIEEVSQKYGYQEELQNVLSKILPAMLDTATYEEKQIFYRMLKHTPIVIISKDDEERNKKILDKYRINPNKHIKELDIDEGEYGNQVPDGAFCSDPVLDEELNLLGSYQYLYVKALDNDNLVGNRKEFVELFGTRIIVPHLIHELGHAWAAEKNQYEIDENGILTQRVGTAELKYELKKQEDGTYTKRKISQTGLMIEEGLNTNIEEESMMRFLNIDSEKLDELYRGILIPSNYRGLVSNTTSCLQTKTSKKLLRDWRLLGDKSAKEKLNTAIEQTERYHGRNELSEEMKNKIEIFNNPKSKTLEELFSRRKNEFFPDKTDMSGIEIIDNGMLQFYNIKVNQIAFMGREDALTYYGDVIRSIAGEVYSLINQTEEKFKDLEEKNLGN